MKLLLISAFLSYCSIGLAQNISTTDISAIPTTLGGSNQISITHKIGEIASLSGSNYFSGGFLYTITTGSNISVYENQSIEVDAFPNPVVDLLHLNCSLNQGCTYSIFNSKGALVSCSTKELQHHEINFSSLARGSYILVVTTANQSYSYNIIKE